MPEDVSSSHLGNVHVLSHRNQFVWTMKFIVMGILLVAYTRFIFIRWTKKISNNL